MPLQDITKPIGLLKIDTQEYPISITEFKNRFPLIIFANDFNNYQDYGYAPVYASPQPTTAYNQSVREIVPEFTSKGRYEQRWEVVNIADSMTQEEYQEFETNYINNLKAEKLNQLANLRYKKETAGIEANGMAIRTDRESQALINGAYVSTIINPNFTVDWKCENGWITLNAEQIAGIASLVANHVQSCFTQEKQLTELIKAATTVDEVNAVELN